MQTPQEELEQVISDSTNSGFIKDALSEKEILKQQLILFHEGKAKALMLRSKTRWTESSEEPTKYKFQQYKLMSVSTGLKLRCKIINEC